LNKVKEKCHELKGASTTTKTKAAMVRAELKMIGTADMNTTVTLPQRYVAA